MLGPTLNEVDFNSLEPRLNLLKKEDIDVFTRQIQQKIKALNAKLTQGEILTEASKEDPVGYVCQKQVLNITEIHFVEKVHCYNTTEEVCSLVKVAKSQGSIFSLVLYLPSFMYSCPISHILENGFFCLGRLSSYGLKKNLSNF